MNSAQSPLLPMTSSKNKLVQEWSVDMDSAVKRELKTFLSHTITLNDYRWLMYKTKLNSVARVCERTLTTERPPLVNEFSANVCG
jgi:hypothetical protein